MRRSRRDIVVVTSVALALRLGVVLVASPRPVWDGAIYVRAADQLAQGQGYLQSAIHPLLHARPTAFYPVGLPAVLAFLRALGMGAAGDLALQLLASIAVVPFAWAVGRRLGGRRAGRAAAWMAALWPGGVLLSASWLTEPLFGALLAGALVPLVWSRRRALPWRVALSGLLLGLCAYVRPTALLCAPLFGAAAGARWGRGSGPRRAVASLALALVASLCAAAPLVPWAARNARALGEPVLVSTNGGANLLLGTIGDGRYRRIPRAIDCPRGDSEIARDACRGSRARERIAAGPLSWVARGTVKLAHTFGYESAPAFLLADGDGARGAAWLAPAIAVSSAFYWLVLLLGAASLRSRLRSRVTRWPAVLLVAPVIAVALLHFVYIGGDRYHLPLVPLLCAPAADALCALLQRGRAAQTLAGAA